MAGNYKDLAVYQKAFNLAFVIFKLSENFDKSEKYSLTDQIRRSSRSVCANLVEAYRKTQFEELFSLSEEIGCLLNHMMQNPANYRGNMNYKK